jgi:hypothetical protein
MLVNIDKLKNLISLISRDCENLGKQKLFKLMFLIDFEHYSKTGRSVSGLSYLACEKGPIPKELDEMISFSPENFSGAVKVEAAESQSGMHSVYFRHVQFDRNFFSRRELKIIESIITEYRHHTVLEMIEFTRRPESPWTRTYANGEGRNKEISYDFALTSEGISKEEIEEREKDRQLMRACFGAE